MSSSHLFTWPENSKLSAEAPEFTSTLNIGASVFIPKSHQNNIDVANFSRREKLVHDINAGQLECLVCLDKIQPDAAVWSCKTCFHIMHLNCIVKWIESSEWDEGWRCCACQNISKSLPRKYLCFCGKTMNPRYNPYNQYKTAHSCGEICGRYNDCWHRCTEPCHPGPCPPCQVLRKCYCGKTLRMGQCSEKGDLCCGQRCDKELSCKKHTCEKLCHVGNCGKCTQMAIQTCHCKKEAHRTNPCTKENNSALDYSCRQPCDKQLNCDNHTCKSLCHAGPCADCELLPDKVKTCPCGKLQIEKDQRKSCVDPIPLCKGKCEKRLDCGKHSCNSECHTGPCPRCDKWTIKCSCYRFYCRAIRMHSHVVKCGEFN